MKFFDFFFAQRKQQPRSADTAKQRLQVLVAVDRTGGPDFLPLMQRELIEVIRKYVSIDEQKVNVDFQQGMDFSTLELNIELPSKTAT